MIASAIEDEQLWLDRREAFDSGGRDVNRHAAAHGTEILPVERGNHMETHARFQAPLVPRTNVDHAVLAPTWRKAHADAVAGANGEILAITGPDNGFAHDCVGFRGCHAGTNPFQSRQQSSPRGVVEAAKRIAGPAENGNAEYRGVIAG